MAISNHLTYEDANRWRHIDTTQNLQTGENYGKKSHCVHQSYTMTIKPPAHQLFEVIRALRI
jgi:hypothetical protein